MSFIRGLVDSLKISAFITVSTTSVCLLLKYAGQETTYILGGITCFTAMVAASPNPSRMSGELIGLGLGTIGTVGVIYKFIEDVNNKKK